MRFSFEQRVAAPVDEVAAAFVDPGFYDHLSELPKLGRPEVLDRNAEGDRVRMRVRYRFTGDLSAAARAVLDPAKLSWVEESVHDLGTHEVTFRLVADHYADRFRCQGDYRFEPDGDGTCRRSEGELSVRTPLVGRAVERAIVSGLGEHLDDEVQVLERWLARR